MLSLARVLVTPPRLLIADELSLGLAPIVVDEVYRDVARRARLPARRCCSSSSTCTTHFSWRIGPCSSTRARWPSTDPSNELGDRAAQVLAGPDAAPST